MPRTSRSNAGRLVAGLAVAAASWAFAGDAAAQTTRATLSVSQNSVMEGDDGSTSITYTIRLSRPAFPRANVNFGLVITGGGTIEAGTATPGVDYRPLATGGDGPQTVLLRFNRNEQVKQITIQVYGDETDEYDETIVARLSGAAFVQVDTSPVTVTITDDDEPPTLSIDSPTVTEGDPGSTTDMTWTATLDAASEKEIRVDYADAGTGTAKAGEDYAPSSGTLTFAAGETSKTITAQVFGDETYERPDETVHLALSVNDPGSDPDNDPPNVTLDAATATGTIEDDDPADHEVGIGRGDAVGVGVAVRVQEGASAQAELTVQLDRPAVAEMVVFWRTEDLDAGGGAGAGLSPAAAGGGGDYVPARAGEDYVAVTDGRLTIAAGATAGPLSVRILDDDVRIEPVEAFRVRLTGVDLHRQADDRLGSLADDHVAIVEIVDNDVAPQRRSALSKVLAGTARRVAAQAVEVIEERFGPRASAPQAALGGQTLAFDRSAVRDARGMPGQRRISAEEMLIGSRFDLPLDRRDAENGWRMWARGAVDRFDSRLKPGSRLSGKLHGGWFGVDRRVGPDALVGVALSRSDGGVDYAADGATTGEAEIALTAVLPYAHWTPQPGLAVWGVLGMGAGDAGIVDEVGAVETGVSMRMAAVGMRHGLTAWQEIDLAVKADAFLASMSTSAAEDLPEAKGDASRLRARLEGRRSWEISGTERAELVVDLGGRWDAGDAEYGLGLELGAGVDYVDTAQGFTVGVELRGLLAHREKLEEWGAALTARLDPGVPGRGPRLTVAPEWRQRGAGSRLELGWGLPVHDGRGLLTPYAGLSLGERVGRGWRIGARAALGSRATVSLETAQRRGEARIGVVSSLRW